MKIFCGIVLLAILAGCQQQRVQPTVSYNIQPAKIPSQESWTSKVVFTDSGKTKAILHAGHIRVFIDSQKTLLDSNIKIDFYDLNQLHSSTLTSKRGRVDDATENLWAQDSVVVISDSGVSIQTEELMWRNKDRKIVSDKFVTIISPKEKIQGYGFESDQGLKNYIIYNITYITKRDTL